LLTADATPARELSMTVHGKGEGSQAVLSSGRREVGGGDTGQDAAGADAL
jgi:hypothetical protein